MNESEDTHQIPSRRHVIHQTDGNWWVIDMRPKYKSHQASSIGRTIPGNIIGPIPPGYH